MAVCCLLSQFIAKMNMLASPSGSSSTARFMSSWCCVSSDTSRLLWHACAYWLVGVSLCPPLIGVNDKTARTAAVHRHWSAELSAQRSPLTVHTGNMYDVLQCKYAYSLLAKNFGALHLSWKFTPTLTSCSVAILGLIVCHRICWFTCWLLLLSSNRNPKTTLFLTTQDTSLSFHSTNHHQPIHLTPSTIQRLSSKVFLPLLISNNISHLQHKDHVM